jgi:hypothetical protein
MGECRPAGNPGGHQCLLVRAGEPVVFNDPSGLDALASYQQRSSEPTQEVEELSTEAGEPVGPYAAYEQQELKARINQGKATFPSRQATNIADKTNAFAKGAGLGDVRADRARAREEGWGAVLLDKLVDGVASVPGSPIGAYRAARALWNADKIVEGIGKKIDVLSGGDSPEKTELLYELAGAGTRFVAELLIAKKVAGPKGGPVELVEAPTTFRDAGGRLRTSDGRFAFDGGAKKAKPSAGTHGNTAGTQEAVLYERYDAEGKFLKHGISQDPAKRYSKAELAGGYLIETQRGPRVEILAIERELVETNPGPLNKEPWAGKRKKVTTLDVSAQFGGRDASATVLPHFRALKAAMRGRTVGGFPFAELAFILRVDGNVNTYGHSGAGNVEFDKKGQFVAVDIGLTHDDLSGANAAELAALISRHMMASIEVLRCLESPKFKGVDWGLIERDLLAVSNDYVKQMSKR